MKTLINFVLCLPCPGYHLTLGQGVILGIYLVQQYLPTYLGVRRHRWLAFPHLAFETKWYHHQIDILTYGSCLKTSMQSYDIAPTHFRTKTMQVVVIPYQYHSSNANTRSVPTLLSAIQSYVSKVVLWLFFTICTMPKIDTNNRMALIRLDDVVFTWSAYDPSTQTILVLIMF